MLRSVVRLTVMMLILSFGIACTSMGGQNANGGASSSTPTASSSSAKVVMVEETEFKIDMPKTLPAGPTLFKVKDTGKFPHNLKIKGNGIEKETASTLQSGQSGELRVDLKPGTYQVWCAVDSHAEKGMKLTLTVK